MAEMPMPSYVLSVPKGTAEGMIKKEEKSNDPTIDERILISNKTTMIVGMQDTACNETNCDETHTSSEMYDLSNISGTTQANGCLALRCDSQQSGSSVIFSAPFAKPKKTKKPARPLSAYNIFFRHERARILMAAENGIPIESIVNSSLSFFNLNQEENKIEKEDMTCDKYAVALEGIRSLLQNNPFHTDNATRPHRKSHGMISFTKLIKLIAAAWNETSNEVKALFQRLADEDKQRYTSDRDAYKNNNHSQKKNGFHKNGKARNKREILRGNEVLIPLRKKNRSSAVDDKSETQGSSLAAALFVDRKLAVPIQNTSLKLATAHVTQIKSAKRTRIGESSNNIEFRESSKLSRTDHQGQFDLYPEILLSYTTSNSPTLGSSANMKVTIANKHSNLTMAKGHIHSSSLSSASPTIPVVFQACHSFALGIEESNLPQANTKSVFDVSAAKIDDYLCSLHPLQRQAENSLSNTGRCHPSNMSEIAHTQRSSTECEINIKKASAWTPLHEATASLNTDSKDLACFLSQLNWDT